MVVHCWIRYHSSILLSAYSLIPFYLTFSTIYTTTTTLVISLCYSIIGMVIDRNLLLKFIVCYESFLLVFLLKILLSSTNISFVYLIISFSTMQLIFIPAIIPGRLRTKRFITVNDGPTKDSIDYFITSSYNTN